MSDDQSYDYIVVGKYRNRDAVADAVKELRAANKTVYCFLDSVYEGDGIKYESTADPERIVANLEGLADWKTNPTFRKIFDADMDGLKKAKALILVFPGGTSSHIELGVAYGMGKKCYGVGDPEKAETLYCLFDDIFPDTEALLEGAS